MRLQIRYDRKVPGAATNKVAKDDVIAPVLEPGETTGDVVAVTPMVAVLSDGCASVVMRSSEEQDSAKRS